MKEIRQVARSLTGKEKSVAGGGGAGGGIRTGTETSSHPRYTGVTSKILQPQFSIKQSRPVFPTVLGRVTPFSGLVKTIDSVKHIYP